MRRLDSLLDIRWVPVVVHNPRHNRFEGRYALICFWPQADKRWEWVQQGKHPEADAYDIIGWLCEDMQDAQSVPASDEGVTERVVALLGSMDNTRYPWKQRMQRMVEKNRRVPQQLKQEAMDMAHDAAEHFYRQAKNVPQVQGANFDKKGRLVK